jgi:hypothetical protein
MYRWIVMIWLVAIPIVKVARAEPAQSAGVCEAVRGNDKLRAILAHMDKLPALESSFWNGYRPDTASYVFLIPGPAKQSCGVLWREGKVTTTIEFTTAPRMSTPLYGYFTPPPAPGNTVIPVDSYAQPIGVQDQLQTLGVQRAVFIPIEGLPFELGSAEEFDLSVHEAFHLYVQLPVWSGLESPHRWPSWDRQPDRQRVGPLCYGSTDPQKLNITLEREHLLKAAMTALTTGETDSVCMNTRAFIQERRRRWTDLNTVRVPATSFEAISCAHAEAIMELEEGVPDFVAWMSAHTLGIVNNDRVRQRFGATMAQPFYVLGTMQLVVLRHLLGAQFLPATAQIASSSSWESGAMFSLLESQVERMCR